jgi:hypothetical protein
VAAACEPTSLLPLTSVLLDEQQHLMHCAQVLAVKCCCIRPCLVACSNADKAADMRALLRT